MDKLEILSANGLVNLLLGIVGVLLLRLLSVIDKNTQAVGKLQTAVEGLGLLLETTKERINRIEQDFAKQVGTLHAEVDLNRSRYHDLANKVQVVLSRVELFDLRAKRTQPDDEQYNR